MQHLDTERLAAFDHEAPSDEELLHLAACSACRAERDAFAALARLACVSGEVPTSVDAPRLTDWNSLATRLRAEGLLAGDPVTAEHAVPVVVRSIGGAAVSSGAVASVPLIREQPRRMHEAANPPFITLVPKWAMQVAAAVILAVGGAAVGRVSAGAPIMPQGQSQSGINSLGILPVSLGGDSFSSIGEATQMLDRAQHDYERASLWLAGHDTTMNSSAAYRKRLAALDQMLDASREALHAAPLDPVLNHYYKAAYSARETTLQQLGGALAVDKSIQRF